MLLRSTIKPNYKITHAVLSFALPLSDWLLLVSPTDGAWAGAAGVFALVSPMIARTSDTCKRMRRIAMSANENRLTCLHAMTDYNPNGTGFKEHKSWSMEPEMPCRKILHNMFIIEE